MPLFVISFTDKPDSQALRAANREAHLAYMAASGLARLAGPYLNEGGEPIGSLIIVEAEDEAAAKALQRGDPYAEAGLPDRVEVRPWRCTVGQMS
ncbi:MAG TPA: YciI family protein [Caulobacteraceae bacterium]|jgi:uncharacterized protein YciI|nr:YciI family protein [Caulobacteraceae bacterium]